MQALSVRDPWATLIVRYHKSTENRTRRVLYRGPVVICASKAINILDEEEWKDVAKKVGLGRRGWQRLNEEIPINPGYALGTVDIVGCDENVRTRWDEPGFWHWRLDNPRPFVKPFKVKGSLNFFNIPDALVLKAQKI